MDEGREGPGRGGGSGDLEAAEPWGLSLFLGEPRDAMGTAVPPHSHRELTETRAWTGQHRPGQEVAGYLPTKAALERGPGGEDAPQGEAA